MLDAVYDPLGEEAMQPDDAALLYSARVAQISLLDRARGTDTAAAADRRHDQVTWRQVTHTRADLNDAADGFVAHDQELESRRQSAWPAQTQLHDVAVGAAHPNSQHRHAHVQRIVELWLGHFGQPRLAAARPSHYGAHASSARRARPPCTPPAAGAVLRDPSVGRRRRR